VLFSAGGSSDPPCALQNMLKLQQQERHSVALHLSSVGTGTLSAQGSWCCCRDGSSGYPSAAVCRSQSQSRAHLLIPALCVCNTIPDMQHHHSGQHGPLISSNGNCNNSLSQEAAAASATVSVWQGSTVSSTGGASRLLAHHVSSTIADCMLSVSGLCLISISARCSGLLTNSV
jgi:hypothetical protein